MKERSGAVVALKDLTEAKSRFASLAPAVRRRLAELMAVTVARALADVVDELVVVTAAPGVAGLLAAYGVRADCLADPGRGLNPALLAGSAELRARDCRLVLACMADLPAVTSADVAAAVRGCTGAGRWFVPDADGTGTTLLVARDQPLDPAFGPGSATRHRAGGAVALPAGAALRRDADDADDLVAAAQLGLQPPVSALVGPEGRIGPDVPVGPHVTVGSDVLVGPDVLVGSEGGTRHDTAVVAGPADSGWSLITSGGSRVLASPSAVGAELRTLATGQRVHLTRDGGSVRHVWL